MNSKIKIYGISGLGADEKVFQFLQLNYELTPIIWIQPKKNESISNYSMRLSAKINQSETFVLIGVSFGGLVAKEISDKLKPALTILISSISSKNELPFLYKVLAKSRITSIIPAIFLNPPNFITQIMFGAKDKKTLYQILENTDVYFNKWAINQLINWKNDRINANILKINGSNDKLLPAKYSKNEKIILNGEHFMIVDRAKEISELINLEINKIDQLQIK